MVIFWAVLGVLLLLFELRHLAFYALFGGVGALAAAGVAVALPGAVIAQVAVAVFVSVVGVLTVRPMVSRAFHHGSDGSVVARGVHGGIVGQQALTLDVVGRAQAPGHVRFSGERWLALSGSDAPIPAETTVVVTAVSGTTLVVWPVDTSVDLPNRGPELGEAPESADGGNS